MLTLHIQQQKYVGGWIKRKYLFIYNKFGYVYEYFLLRDLTRKSCKIMWAT